MKHSVIILLLLLSGCSLFSDDDPSEKSVEGLYITDPTGLVLSEWRDPPDYELFYPPRTNPAKTGFSLTFESESTEIELKISPLRLNNSRVSSYRKELGSSSVIDGNVYDKTINLQESGVNGISVDAKDRDGNRLPRGFYRIHIDKEYHDVFVMGMDESITDAMEYLNDVE